MNISYPHYILCATLYVINDSKQFLLLKHPKLKKWVPPGGKIEPNEMPQDAAIRECLEETGLEVKLIGTVAPLTNGLINPYGLQYNPASDGCGSHLDFIYFGKVLSKAHEPPEEMQWFSVEEISKLNTFDSIAKWCAFFSKL